MSGATYWIELPDFMATDHNKEFFKGLGLEVVNVIPPLREPGDTALMLAYHLWKIRDEDAAEELQDKLVILTFQEYLDDETAEYKLRIVNREARA